jgi:hypothetical protein
MTAAGCQLMTWFGVACELHRDWRNDIEGLGFLFSNHLLPHHQLHGRQECHEELNGAFPNVTPPRLT